MKTRKLKSYWLYGGGCIALYLCCCGPCILGRHLENTQRIPNGDKYWAAGKHGLAIKEYELALARGVDTIPLADRSRILEILIDHHLQARGKRTEARRLAALAAQQDIELSNRPPMFIRGYVASPTNDPLEVDLFADLWKEELKDLCYPVVQDDNGARIIVELGCSSQQAGNVIPRLKLVRFIDAENKSIVRLTYFDPHRKSEIQDRETSRKVAENYLRTNVLAFVSLRKGKNNGYYSAQSNVDSPYTIDRPDLDTPKRRVFVQSDKEEDTVFFKTIHKAGFDIARNVRDADLLLKVAWSVKKLGMMYEGVSGEGEHMNAALSMINLKNQRESFSTNVWAATPDRFTTFAGGTTYTYTYSLWLKDYEEKEPKLIQELQKAAVSSD